MDEEQSDPETVYLSKNYTRIWRATPIDGIHCVEEGPALPDSEPQSIHARGTHAPHVVPHEGKYYVFYTLHASPEFAGDPSEKHMGLAICDRIDGIFRHVAVASIPSPTNDGVSFDHPCMIGLATAPSPVGP